jgi:hypothetical protein
MQYQYEFVRLTSKNGVLERQSTEYREVVREYAARGWRLVTIYAPGDSFGTPTHVDLIFEQPAHGGDSSAADEMEGSTAMAGAESDSDAATRAEAIRDLERELSRPLLPPSDWKERVVEKLERSRRIMRESPMGRGRL